mgnify:CR=1 FL=1
MSDFQRAAQSIIEKAKGADLLARQMNDGGVQLYGDPSIDSIGTSSWSCQGVGAAVGWADGIALAPDTLGGSLVLKQSVGKVTAATCNAVLARII